MDNKYRSVQAACLLLIAEGMNTQDSWFNAHTSEATYNAVMADLVQDIEKSKMNKEWREV